MIDRWEARQASLLPRKRLAQLGGAAACLLSLGFLLCIPAWAQLDPRASVPTTAQPEVPTDSLGRSTPKGTTFGFFNAARKGQDELAAQYLNTRSQGEAAAVLARQLFTVLDHRLPPILTQLSDKPEGSLSNLLRPDRELLGTIASDNGNVDIFLERVVRGGSGPLWLFSNETLASIPDLYAEINAVSLDSILPQYLVNTRVAGIALFQWLGVFVGMPLFYFLTVLLNRFLSPFIGLWRRRLRKDPELPNPDFLPNPVRLLLLALAIRWMISAISLPLFARQFWSTTSTVLTIIATVWLLILFNGWGEQYLHRLFRNHQITGTASMLRLGRRTLDLLIIFAGVVVALRHFGVNPTAALAGLGVGGIAVALAAQKTLENLIGGISLIFDETMRVGDRIKVGNIEGVVEDMGLRSTQIRTLDRTVVSVPNGQIASMTLENITSRDKFWFHPILALRHGTTSPQMHAVLDRVRSLLQESRHLEPDSVRVRFLQLGPSSLDVEVFAYVWATDWNQFLEVQEKLLLGIVECIESSGVQMALSTQEILAFASKRAANAKDQVTTAQSA